MMNSARRMDRASYARASFVGRPTVLRVFEEPVNLRNIRVMGGVGAWGGGGTVFKPKSFAALIARLSVIAVFGIGGYVGVRKVIALEAPKAFTVIRNEVTFSKSGNPLITETVRYANRTDGSQAKVRSVMKPDGSGAVMQRMIRNLATGEEILVDGLTESTTSMRMTTKAIETAKMSRPCSTQLIPEKKVLLGFEVVKVVMEHKGESGIRLESWQGHGSTLLSAKRSGICLNSRRNGVA